MRPTQRQLLREYIETILVEDEHGGIGATSLGMIGGGAPEYAAGMMHSNGANSPYGLHYATSNALYKTFVKPFVDVFQVAAGKAKELSQRAIALTKVSIEATLTSLIPFLASDYKNIFEHEKAELDKIRSEYSEVYAATWDAFKNSDVAMAAFFAYPGPVLTGMLAKETPKVALKMLSILSGGELDNTIARIKSAFGGKRRNESLVREDKVNKKQKLADIVTNEKLVKKALSSPAAQRMQSEAHSMVNETLKSLVEHASAIMTATSIDDIEKKLHQKIAGSDNIKKLKKEERALAEKELLTSAKKSMKEFYVKNLESHVKEALDAEIPEDSPFVTEYRHVIAKIKSM